MFEVIVSIIADVFVVSSIALSIGNAKAWRSQKPNEEIYD